MNPLNLNLVFKILMKSEGIEVETRTWMKGTL